MSCPGRPHAPATSPPARRPEQQRRRAPWPLRALAEQARARQAAETAVTIVEDEHLYGLGAHCRGPKQIRTRSEGLLAASCPGRNHPVPCRLSLQGTGRDEKWSPSVDTNSRVG